jgi:hypothetical protein
MVGGVLAFVGIGGARGDREEKEEGRKRNSI